MHTMLTRQFLDACHKAKRIISYLPPLPEWMTPRQVQVIDAIHELTTTEKNVRTSDVARFLEGTMPSVTRMISVLEAHGAVTKMPSENDKRAHFLALTPYGEELYRNYIELFHNHIAELFANIAEADMHTAIDVIDQAEASLKNDEKLLTILSIKKETEPDL